MPPNRLIGEHSPYLLQHAHNPVDWYPWGDEAFAKAKREHKPVFLSIGYATCHWCHVMAHESFEDEAVARLLNEAFVCVKVDREERPDIDGVYMTVCQLTSGSGGWPLTVLLTPDKQPFFAGTYFPKHTRGNRIGMLELVPRLKAAWKDRTEDVLASVDQISTALKQSARLHAGQTVDESVLHAAYQALSARFDVVCGGFGTRPKFPTPHQLTFLLRYWRRTGESHALHMVEHTLQQMRLGGLFDQVGFGFHRYATDAQWLLPHFEKMLYDQALLTVAYVEAFQAIGALHYRQVAQETLTYVLRDLTSPEGAFYSAEDADSEGEEGKFYVWRMSQLERALDPQALALAVEVFGVEQAGNFFEEASGHKTGANVLHLKKPLDELAHTLNLAPHALAARVEAIRQKLCAARAARPRPLLDDKVLADWNGLTIAALAKAAFAFDEPRYAQAAERAAAFLRQHLWLQGRLLHRYRAGNAGIDGYLNDYAFVIWGLLELYQATFKTTHLNWALALAEAAIKDFWDADRGGFFFTATYAEALPVRQKEIYDGALPSGNGVMLSNLLRLSLMTGDLSLEERAWQLITVASEHITQSPSAFTQLLQGLELALGPAYSVVLAGPFGQTQHHPLMHALRTSFQPNAALLLRDPAQAAGLDSLAPFAASHIAIDGGPTAYVCQRHSCKPPTQSPETLLEMLRGQ